MFPSDDYGVDLICRTFDAHRTARPRRRDRVDHDTRTTGALRYLVKDINVPSTARVTLGFARHA